MPQSRFARATFVLVLPLASTAVGAVPAAEGQGPVRSCESLATLSLPNATLTSAARVDRGSFEPPQGKPITDLPAFCRVVGVLAPTSDSHIEFEAWLPAAGWNGKFQGIGNGGMAGSIGYEGLGLAVSRGYASASTDTGHKGSPVDGSWALGHPEKVVDFGHRAIHEMTVAAKAIVTAFYGVAARRSYFAGCSNGGRQALMEAQRYPDDYDGLVAGAPAASWTGLFANFVWNAQAMADAAAYVSPAKLAGIERAVVLACDRRDGVADGVLARPDACAFDPRTIVCKSTDSDDCLAPAQADGLARIYSGPRARDGRRVFPGFPPGAETGPGGWGLWITGAEPGKSLQTVFATQIGANMVFDRPDWDIRTYVYERDQALVEAKLAKNLDATDPDLGAFRKRGGKLIVFHGWNDPALPVEATIEYVDAVRARLGLEVADSFLRLYLMPGLQHCYGGPGAHYCGGLSVPVAAPERDFSAALERWVEDGVAPGTMIAVKPADGATLTTVAGSASSSMMSRPLCPYPQAAVFKGDGSPDAAASYRCLAP